MAAYLLTAKNSDQLQNPERSVIEYGLPFNPMIVFFTLNRLLADIT